MVFLFKALAALVSAGIFSLIDQEKYLRELFVAIGTTTLLGGFWASMITHPLIRDNWIYYDWLLHCCRSTDLVIR